jgi:quinolinate synthase
MGLQEEILALKEEKNALILAHNYQRGEIQDIADVVGDSLVLAKKAQEYDVDIVLMSAVDFMAETTSVLNPKKKVIMPDLEAKCPMAAMLPAKIVRKAKREHPKADVVLYVNTWAEARAEADCLCTSANSVEVVNAMDSDTVIFGPDKNLSYYVSKRSDKEIITIPEHGLCPTHHQITLADVLFAKEDHPKAELVVHPECIPEVQDLADHIASTQGMVNYAKKSKAKEMIIGTEEGLIHRLKKEAPDKRYYLASKYAVCPNMKMHTLEKIKEALKEERNVVRVPERVAKRVRAALERMLEISR